jgi:histidinol-phosphate aminotransferase
MDSVRKPATHLQDIVAYDPKYLPAKTYLNANENSRDVPGKVRSDIEERLRKVAFNRYPDPLANSLRDAIAASANVDRDSVLIGNGGDELLFNIALAWGGTSRTFLSMPPTFSAYEANARLTGTNIVRVPLDADYRIDEEKVLEQTKQKDIDYIIITSPNNPTGGIARQAFVKRLLSSTDALVVLDEAYGEFSGASSIPLLKTHKNLVVLRTFSKALCLAGVRLGYMFADRHVISELIKVRQPYSVDSVSQAIGMSVFENRALFEERIQDIMHARDILFKALSEIPGVTPYPSRANYILFKVKGAAQIWHTLYEQGILVRDFSGAEYLSDCLRTTVGTKEENEAFIGALKRSILKVSSV